MQDNHMHVPIDDESITRKKDYFSFGYWKRLPSNLISSTRSKILELTLSQKFYLVAFILLIASTGNDFEQDPELLWVGIIAGIGLVRELWHVFNRIWQHMLGKGFILVLYAATANFALAISALKINAITGIEPTPFVFTLGFATLLMLPLWLLVASVIFFSIALVAGNVLVIIGALLRLIRVKIQVHWEDKVFVFMSMVLRVVLIPYVIMTIFYIAVPYAKQIELFDHPIALVKEAIEKSHTTFDEIESDSMNVKMVFGKRLADVTDDNQNEVEFLDTLIASFIFNFETYPYSACKKTPEQRSLPIDEHVVLIVEKDDSELGHHFFVKPCVGNYETADKQEQLNN